MAMAYSSLSALNNTDGRLEEAFKNASLAFTTALNTENDSAKVICTIQLGNTYLQRSDILMAFKTFTNAQNIAVQKGKESLLPPVYHAMGILYKRLDKDETAKEYVFRSLAINKKGEHVQGMINDYIFLAKLSNYIAGKEYLQEALHLAGSLQLVPLKIEAGKILFSHMMLQEKPPDMLAYLEENPELKNVFINTGPHYFDWMLAEIYFYGGAPDSALHYFKMAEPAFSTGYDLNSRKNFFGEYASCLEELRQIPEAIVCYQRSAELARSAADLRNLKYFTGALKNLYQQQGDYRKAFEYSILYDNYKDSVDIMSKEKDMALLEVANEEKEQQRQLELAAANDRRRHNLQYMLITIIIVTAFILLIMIGMFRVSAFTIRLMGFFSLIFLFEFIILILDKWIHHLTHGEPWKIWLIKIGIISILLPVHHFAEHKLIRYLMSHHLITLRSRIRLFPFFNRNKKPLPGQATEEGVLDPEKPDADA
jgi:tetratricopeptide (TPR) repeat protein